MPYGVDPSDATMMARTMWGENTKADPDEYTAMANVMRNRQLSGNPAAYGGDTMSQILRAKNQFQAWNDPTAPNYPMKAPLDSPSFRSAYQAASNVMSGMDEDPTGGAVNYYNPKGVDKTPPFAVGRQGMPIGQHVFYKPQSDIAPEDQAAIDKFYPKQKSQQGGASDLTNEDRAAIQKHYPGEKTETAPEAPNARVAGAFEDLPVKTQISMGQMEPGLREVGPSSETLAKLIGALGGGAGAFGAAKGLQGIITNLPTSVPRIAKMLAQMGAIGAGGEVIKETFGAEKGGVLTDLVHRAIQHATDVAP